MSCLYRRRQSAPVISILEKNSSQLNFSVFNLHVPSQGLYSEFTSFEMCMTFSWLCLDRQRSRSYRWAG